jgi:hypothetical protein
MNEKLSIQGKALAIATYKPKQGKENELMKLVATHLPTLRELGLVTDKPSYLAKSSDGSIIEIFEWASGDAINTAHQHPSVAEIWNKMGLVADFFPISSLPESESPFTGFEIINQTPIS